MHKLLELEIEDIQTLYIILQICIRCIKGELRKLLYRVKKGRP